MTQTSDQINTNPQLGPLANNGGPTAIHLLLPGSPAIDRGAGPASMGPTVDQRGIRRPSDFGSISNAPNGDGSDIGAVEIGPNAPKVTTNAATGVGASGATLNGTVGSEAAQTAVTFRVSTDSTLSTGVTTTAAQNFPGNANDAPVSQAITGLAARTIYFFSQGTNSVGTTDGSILSFTTLNTAPTAPNGNATGTTGDTKTVTISFPTTDSDGDAVAITAVTAGAHLTINSFTITTVTFTPASDYAGVATFTYTVDDGSGTANSSATGTITVTITDNDPPTGSSITSGPPSLTNSRSATFSGFNGSDNIAVTSFEGKLDGGSYTAVTSPATFTNLSDGSHSFSLRAKDAAGNVDGNPAVATWTVDGTPPAVSLGGPSQSAAKSGDAVSYTVTYSDPHFDSSSLSINDIDLNKTGTANATVAVDAGTGATRTVTLSNLSGNGTLGISIAAGTARDTFGNSAPAAGPSATFVVDTVAPFVSSIVRAAANPTKAANVTFTVTFSESVTGVDVTDFALTTTGLSGASVSSVTPINASRYTVSVNNGTGNGTVRLDLSDNDSIVDQAGNPLGGTGSGNGNFAAGETYTVDQTNPAVSSIVRVGFKSDVRRRLGPLYGHV